MRRRLIVAGIGICAGLAAAVLAWSFVRARTQSGPEAADAAVTTWRGGQTNLCLLTVDGRRLQAFADDYNLVMFCGIDRAGTDHATDRAVTVSRAHTMEPAVFNIEEAISGPMRVLLEERARQGRGGDTSADAFLVLHEEPLWYELAALPKTVDAFDVRTLADVERLGGRRLLPQPLQTVLEIRR